MVHLPVITRQAIYPRKGIMRCEVMHVRKQAKPRTGLRVPPVFKLLFRGYIIMGFILALHYLGLMASIPFTVFLVTVVSVAMVFGVGYLLLMESRPVRASSVTIPDTVLFFAKGALLLYFVSLLAGFGLAPAAVTSVIMLLIAAVMVIAGAASYVYEVIERARPVRRPAAIRTRPGPSSRRSAARGRSS